MKQEVLIHTRNTLSHFLYNIGKAIRAVLSVPPYLDLMSLELVILHSKLLQQYIVTLIDRFGRLFFIYETLSVLNLLYCFRRRYVHKLPKVGHEEVVQQYAL